MLELAFCLSMKYWNYIKFLNLAYNFIWSRLIQNGKQRRKNHHNKTLAQKSSLSLPAKDSMLKLSLYTINTTFFISAREIFISKAAKNGLMHARIFRAQTATHFFSLKNITWKTAKLSTVSAKLLQCCYN